MTEEAHAAFRLLTGLEPMRWQRRLCRMLLCGAVPSALALPTGLGKTSVMTLWLVARGLGAPLPRRLVYIVDRRVVVDQASSEALRLCERLSSSQDPLLARLRGGLGLDKGVPLAVSTLRGGLAESPAWRADPTASAIIVGTVDMIGSRLLFEGYGVSRRMRPLHAGLLGCDTLVVLDEAHLVPPFAALLRSIAGDEALRGAASDGLVPPMRLMTLSATGHETADDDPFRLEPDEAEEEIPRQRLSATKQLRILDAVAQQYLPHRLAEAARTLAGSTEAPARVIVFCDRRADAQAVAEQLRRQEPDVGTHLLVGERRGHERALEAAAIEDEGFLAGAGPPKRPAILVATSAGEVGADFDADHMVADVVAFERMVQRLGRVNRRGGEERKAQVVLVPTQPVAKASAAQLLRDRLAANTADLLRRLPSDGEVVDASPAALEMLKRDPALADLRGAATTPPPLRPALTRALVEAWSLTGLAEHTGRPEVAPWLRGWVEEEPQVQLFWRRFLPWRSGEQPVPHEVSAFFEHAPPSPAELLEAPAWRAVEVVAARAHALRSGGAPVDRPAALVLSPALEFEGAMRLEELARLDATNGVARLSGRILALASALGGLSEDGLLADGAEGVAQDAEGGPRGIACTVDAPGGMEGVALRFSVAAPGAGAALQEGWVEAHAWPIALDAEGEPDKVLTVWTPERARADPALACSVQTLADHAAAVEEAARRIGDRLNLPQEYRDMLRHAARLHDAGKAAARWQDAFSAPRQGRPYAKTDAGRVDHALLDGYRHELGSLAAAEGDTGCVALPEHLRELALHLIAAHHGRARPVLEARGAPMMPSAAEALAREAVLRFARLQRRWGPWGLAWWESLLRLADAEASAALERG